MRKVILLSLVIICAIAIVHGFFMPWATASASATKVAKGLMSQASGPLSSSPFASGFIKGLNKTTDKISDIGGDVKIKTAVSGYDIPTLINKKSSQVAIAIASTMFKDAKDLDKKSMLVYLLPIFALVCVGLGILGLKNKIAVMVMTVLGGAIAIGGLYNMMTIDLSKLPIQITIEQGLWQTMYAYLLICAIGVVWVVLDVKEAKK